MIDERWHLTPFQARLCELLQQRDWPKWRALVFALYGGEPTEERYNAFKVSLHNLRKKLASCGVNYAGAGRLGPKRGYPRLVLPSPGRAR